MTVRGGKMQHDSAWKFELGGQAVPPPPAPDVAVTDNGDGTITVHPLDPASWVPRAVYLEIDAPQPTDPKPLPEV